MTAPARRQRPKRPVNGAPKHAPRVPFALLVVTLIAGGLGLLLLLNTVSAANEVHRHDLAARDSSIAAQLQDLQNQVAASAAPANLAQAAAALGMVPAGNPAFLVMGADGSVRVLGSPAPVSDAVVAAIPGKKSHSTSHSTSHSAPKPSHTSPKPSPHSSSGKPKGTSTSPASGRTSGRSSAAPPSSPKPTPTPTPTLVLPGGNR